MRNMRFFAISSLLLAATLTVSAQFKLHSNGRIAFNTDATPLSPISLNYQGNLPYYISLQQSAYNGLYCKIQNTERSGTIYGGYFIISGFPRSVSYMGLRTSVKGNTSDVRPSRVHGIIGESAHGSTSFGVLGKISDSTGGAAIYGTTYSDYGYTDNHLYAGYFDGDAKVTGDLTVEGAIQGVLLGESSSGISSGEVESSVLTDNRGISVSNKFSKLTVSSFRKEKPVTKKALIDKKKVDNEEYSEDELEESEDIKRNVIESQYYEKNHYVLSAEQLEESFPDLVYQKEDGTKLINYMEMIPLLVQTINDLREEISSLKKDYGNSINKSRAAVFEDEETTAVGDATSIPPMATLAQNTPNPFSERTSIRFTLPENAQNAFIYIFDMSGKMQKQIPVSSDMQNVTIEGYELRAGMYIYSLVIGGKEVQTRRMILSK